ncbi:MAG: RelA/SpoT family protein [Bacteroidales bacterium]|nr:RelA/SpoT family protein [Bacteroidales bacterium]
MEDTTNKMVLSSQEELDEQMIQAAFQHLLDTYLATNHRRKVELITKAFNFAKQAHKGVRRRSGEPYILHPIAVAQIACGEIGLGSTSICAALLHDVEEDTDYTNEDLSNLFGPKIANIVEGVTKISGGIFGDRASLQAETFKKLLLTMSDDIRVILIKISDRLHNMRTLSSMLPSKQYKIAGETLYIFAPIADRLGLNKIKTELENLSFKYEHPEEYIDIQNKLASSKVKLDDIIAKFTPPICAALDKMGTHYTIKERIKSPYSIWMKMQNKHVPFDEIFDLLAIRIIFTPKDRTMERGECFNIYSALTDIYKPHPTRFRDWVSNPKANGYQALHNTFMSKDGQWIEVQIRSDRMDDIAEQGFAAHWKYKDKNAAYDENELNKWLDSIKEILDDPQPDTLDLLDTIKLNLFTNEIMVFTPKGELRKMPAGATVVDFAFSVHTFLGSHCLGAKVNHKLVPLSYKLKSGDQVEILTSNKQHVKDEWLNFATTAKARGKIQAALRRERRELQKMGEEVVRQFLTQAAFEPTTAIYERLALFHHFRSRDALFLAIGERKLKLGEDDLDLLKGKKKKEKKGWRRYIPFMGKDDKKADAPAADLFPTDAESFFNGINRKQVLVLNDDNLPLCRFADCCRPIPGDDVIGYLSPEHVFVIHKRKCADAVKLKTRYGNDIVACRWDTHKQLLFDVTIFLRGMDSQGVLYAIADVLHKLTQFQVKSITLSTTDGIFEGKLYMSVFDTADVQQVCNALMSIENITEAVRVE